MAVLTELFRDDALLISSLHNPAGGSGRVLLSFTGVGHDMGGIDVQQPEFFGAGAAYEHVLFITDLTRSWGNALDLDQIARIVQPIIGAGRADALGNSMGGFLALLAPSFLPVRAVVAFSPQFSVDPRIVPWEKRWPEYRAAIGDWTIPSLDGRFQADCRYHVFSGGPEPDRAHVAMLPDLPNVQVHEFPQFDHNVARAFKAAGVLPEVIDRCLDDQFSRAWLDARLDGFVQPVVRSSLTHRLRRKIARAFGMARSA